MTFLGELSLKIALNIGICAFIEELQAIDFKCPLLGALIHPNFLICVSFSGFCCCSTGNLRLQEMMGVMCKERGARLFATDER